MSTVEDDMHAAAYKAAMEVFRASMGRDGGMTISDAIAAAIMAAHGAWVVEQERRAAHRSVIGETCHATGD